MTESLGENNILPHETKSFVGSGVAIKFINRPFGTPLEPIIEQQSSRLTLRAKKSTASSLQKIIGCASASASIMQENERNATNAISCVPEGRRRACGADAADKVTRQLPTGHRHTAGDENDHARQTVQTAAVIMAEPRRTDDGLTKAEEGPVPESRVVDRQNCIDFLAFDKRAKTARRRPLAKYGLIPPQISHNSAQYQLMVPFKNPETIVQQSEVHSSSLRKEKLGASHPKRKLFRTVQVRINDVDLNIHHRKSRGQYSLRLQKLVPCFS